MQLNQFRFLIAVDKYGSISKAAQELYISQSTISLSLINLEEELGHVLLNRSKRGVTLTPEGKEVLKRATVIQDAIESLRDISGRRGNDHRRCAYWRLEPSADEYHHRRDATAQTSV